jgi:hypothetical protein
VDHEQLLRYGAETATFVHPLVLLFVLVAGALALSLPRRYVPIPVLVAMVLVPMGQRVVMAGVDLTMYRLILPCALLRLVTASRRRSFELTRTDWAVIWWVVSGIVTFTLLWGSLGAFLNRLGFAYDVLGTYFLFRALIDDDRGLERILKSLVGLAALVACLMLLEVGTGQNPFGEFGGVEDFAATREGRVRAQGPFSHPILAGTFGATLVPLAIALWWKGRRRLAALGSAAAGVITFASASSGPVLTLTAGVVGLLVWPLRDHLTWVRRAVVVLLLALHMFMNAPVWALVSRIDLVPGSTAWHRYNLIDNFIRRFDEWYLLGTRYTATWGHKLQDQTNQYVSFGTKGGLVFLLVFLLVVKRSFDGLRRARRALPNDFQQQRVLWAIACTVFANLIAFGGVSYFGQMMYFWCFVLGLATAATRIATTQADPARESDSAHLSAAGAPTTAVLQHERGHA